MTNPTSRPHDSGSDGPSNEPRSGIPLPGQHLAGANPAEFADPEQVRAEIDALLSELSAGARGSGSAGLAAALPTSSDAGTDITRRARILEQAHDVLVQALATVDKI